MLGPTDHGIISDKQCVGSGVGIGSTFSWGPGQKCPKKVHM